MSFKKTVKYHVPQKGLYMYARNSGNITELIVLNSTNCEQMLFNEHIQMLIKNGKEGKDISSGKKINLQEDLIVPAGKSLIIECML